MGALIIRIRDSATELLYPKNIALEFFCLLMLMKAGLLDPILKQKYLFNLQGKR
jgi:hypothetical protein